MVLLLAGLTIAHLGVTLFMLTELGADPFNVMIQGLSSHLPVSHGITHMSVCFLIILVLLFVDRSYIKAGTLVCAFVVGTAAGILMPYSHRIVEAVLLHFT